MDLSRLNELISPQNTLYVAFSGGADSMCLAHQLATDPALDARIKIVCLHIDHGLDPGSGKRALRARELAQSLDLPCLTEALHLDAQQNIESTARTARYGFFKQKLTPGDVLVTAHHKDDVAETLLLRMLRGAGISGLSGIESNQSFGHGRLVRPLLDWSRREILDYLRNWQLEWIEDPSNEVLSIDRNFIRHDIMPRLCERFPGAREALNRSATLNRQGAELLSQTLADTVALDQRDHQRLCIQDWTNKKSFEKAELIRSWCLCLKVRPPSGKPLESFVSQIAEPAPDRVPKLTWDSGTIHCYRGHLWLSQWPDVGGALKDKDGARSQPLGYELDWDGSNALDLPDGLGTLHLDMNQFRRSALAQNPSEVLFRVCSQRPGEVINLDALAKSQKTRELLSAAHIPPWQRTVWPRVWLDGTLVACGGRWQVRELNNALSWKTALFGAQPSAEGIS